MTSPVPPCVAAERLTDELRTLPHSVQNQLRAWRDDQRRSLSFTALRDDPAWRAEVEQKVLELLCALDPPASTFTGEVTLHDPETGESIVEHREDGVLLGRTIRTDRSVPA